MGLFDDIFKREEINQLKKALADKTDDILKLESEIAQLSSSRVAIGEELVELKKLVIDKESAISSLTYRRETAQTERAKLGENFEEFKRTSAEQIAQAAGTINELQKTLAEVKPEILAAQTERDAKVKELQDLLASNNEKEHRYQEREIRLAEKSEKLLQERQSLDQRQKQLNELQTQLDNLQRSIKTREADMVRRQCVDEALKERETEIAEWNQLLSDRNIELDVKSAELTGQQSEIEARSRKLEDWARELFVFQNRVAQLDKNTEKLELRNKEIESKVKDQKSEHSVRLAELRQKRSEICKLTTELNQTKVDLKKREEDVKREARLVNSQIEKLSQATSAAGKFNSSLSNSTVLAWLLEDGGPDITLIENGWLGSSGYGPWNDQFLESSLAELDYQFYAMPDPDLEYLIVGRKGWSKADLLAQIEDRQGNSLRIYSQEMFFAKLLTGRDPFDSEDSSLLEAFAADHPALQFLISLPEPLPIVTNEDSANIVEVDGEDFGVSESPLHILGYRVGATSDLSAPDRRKILATCFEFRELEFSDDSDDAYIAKWGRGGGAQRLYRMAAHIKLLANGRVGKDYRKPQSRIDWVSDLKWLKDKYFKSYTNKFTWPGN